MSLSRSLQQKIHRSELAFSLVELMVSVSIILLIAGVVLVRYASFNSATVLKNLAFEVAVSLREAQVLSVSVLGDGSDFSGVYGVHFNWTGAGGDPNQYILYRDLSSSGDGIYSGTSENFEVFTISNDFHITDICRTVGASRSCGINPMSISFVRPDFDARFDQSNNGIDSSITSVEIELQAVDDSSVSKIVEISSTGQISVR